MKFRPEMAKNMIINKIKLSKSDQQAMQKPTTPRKFSTKSRLKNNQKSQIITKWKLIQVIEIASSKINKNELKSSKTSQSNHQNIKQTKNTND